MADAFIVETTALRKTYGSVHALRGLDLQVPAGSICGFLGKNGAGKTTTIKILLGIAHATSGEARVLGLPAGDVEVRRRTAFVSDEKDLYGYMTVAEMIRFTRSFYPRWRADLEQRYARAFELPLERKIKALSRGTRTPSNHSLPLSTPSRPSLGPQSSIRTPSSTVPSSSRIGTSSACTPRSSPPTTSCAKTAAMRPSLAALPIHALCAESRGVSTTNSPVPSS